MKSLILIFIFLSFSCKENSTTTTGDDSKDAKAVFAEDAKTFAIGKLKLSASESVYKMTGAPKPKVLEACIRAKLKESPFFTDSGNTVNINIAYDVLEEKSKSIVLLAEMTESGGKNRLFSAGNRTQSKGEGFEKMGEEACADLVTRLTNSVKVKTSSNDDLIALLSNPESTAGILKNTIQTIREKNVIAAATKLMPLLKHEDKNVAVAAAASLAKFQHKEARAGALKLAEDLSRDKNPAYLPMIYILADIGGSEINEYLNIVSTSHENPRIQEIAKKAIEKAKQKKNPKK